MIKLSLNTCHNSSKISHAIKALFRWCDSCIIYSFLCTFNKLSITFISQESEFLDYLDAQEVISHYCLNVFIIDPLCSICIIRYIVFVGEWRHIMVGVYVVVAPVWCRPKQKKHHNNSSTLWLLCTIFLLLSASSYSHRPVRKISSKFMLSH
jgi:hypothetical protein